MSSTITYQKRVAVLTYDHPHKKTEDVLTNLYLAGFDNVDVVMQDWVEREQMDMLYPQRPGDKNWPQQPVSHPKKFAKAFGYRRHYSTREDLDVCLANLSSDVCVVAGAGILGPEITERFTVVNSHPGYLPFTRGLDTVKWAFYYNLPIGCTTHIVDDRADAGRLIHQVRCPLKPFDDFTRFALRLYDLEMQMLVPALFAVLASGRKEDFPKIDVEGFPAYRRMGRRKEAEMMLKFEELRNEGVQPGDKYMMFVPPPSPWGKPL